MALRIVRTLKGHGIERYFPMQVVPFLFRLSLSSTTTSALRFTRYCARFHTASPPLFLNQLSDRFGEVLAQSLSSPLCALKDLVLADNFFSDRFTNALSKGLRTLRIVSLSPLRNLDVSNNKICDRYDQNKTMHLRLEMNQQFEICSCRC